MFYVGLCKADVHMISEEKSLEDGEVRGCTVRNLELIQDFALVNNLFCDKTGTLTKNDLIFDSLSISNKIFSTKSGMENFKSEVNGHSGKEDQSFIDFWRCLCVCHDATQLQYTDGDGKS